MSRNVCAANTGTGALDVSLELISVRTGRVVAEKTVRLAPLGSGAAASPCVTVDAEAVGAAIPDAAAPQVNVLNNGLNGAGVIVGRDIDASNAFHGFRRAASGTITTFSAPGAGTGVSQGTTAEGINTAGAITGNYADSSNVYHGFVLTP